MHSKAEWQKEDQWLSGNAEASQGGGRNLKGNFESGGYIHYLDQGDGVNRCAHLKIYQTVRL